MPADQELPVYIIAVSKGRTGRGQLVSASAI
jgi:hypothetical protein